MIEHLRLYLKRVFLKEVMGSVWDRYIRRASSLQVLSSDVVSIVVEWCVARRRSSQFIATSKSGNFENGNVSPSSIFVQGELVDNLLYEEIRNTPQLAPRMATTRVEAGRLRCPSVSAMSLGSPLASHPL